MIRNPSAFIAKHKSYLQSRPKSASKLENCRSMVKQKQPTKFKNISNYLEITKIIKPENKISNCKKMQVRISKLKGLTG